MKFSLIFDDIFNFYNFFQIKDIEDLQKFNFVIFVNAIIEKMSG